MCNNKNSSGMYVLKFNILSLLYTFNIAQLLVNENRLHSVSFCDRRSLDHQSSNVDIPGFCWTAKICFHIRKSLPLVSRLK